MGAVTAEVASSSLVVPAILFKQQTQKKIWVHLGPISRRAFPRTNTRMHAPDQLLVTQN